MVTYPPAKWICPTCGEWAIALLPAQVKPTCSSPKHLKTVVMVSTPIPAAVRQRNYRERKKAQETVNK